jgi:hypothetical protein
MNASIDNAYSNAYMKIFYTFDKNVIRSCQFYFGYLPMELEIGLRSLNFLSKLLKCKTNLINQVLDIKADIQAVTLKFNFDINDSTKWHSKMWRHFETLLQHV